MLSLKATEHVLAALAETSRLRLLLLCAAGEQAVGDLALALGQSEPRVSRHLRILAEAGLVERRRQGHRVLYGPVAVGPASDVRRAILAQIDAGDPTLQRDMTRVRRASSTGRGEVLPTESRLGRAMRLLVGTEPTAPGRSALVGLEHLEMIDAVCALGRPALVVAPSAAAAEVARAWIDRHALDCEIVSASRRPDPAAAGSLQALILDRAGAADSAAAASAAGSASDAVPALDAALAQARAWLGPRGRLWLFERYERLEAGTGRVVEHPLAKLRRLLAENGFSCERIRPLESDGVHLLATTAVPAQSSVDAA